MEKIQNASLSQSSQGVGNASDDSSEGNFSFLVQSQESLSQESPVDAEQSHSIRQKRRRTRYSIIIKAPCNC